MSLSREEGLKLPSENGFDRREHCKRIGFQKGHNFGFQKGHKINSGRINVRRLQLVERPEAPLEVKAYCAGLLDGEGTINNYRSDLRPNVVRMNVRISNTNIECLKYIQKYFGGRLSSIKNRKTILWYLDFRYNEVIPLLEQIKDYLIIKQKNANEMLEVLRNREANRI